MGRKKIAIAVTAALAVVAAIGGWMWLHSGPRADGPLRIEDGLVLIATADVGQATTFAQPALINTGARDLVLDSVRLIPGEGSPHALTVETYLVGLPGRSNGGGMSRGEPLPAVEGPWSAFAGTVIKPIAQVRPNGYSLIAVAHLGVLGIAWTDGVEIKYHVGGVASLRSSALVQLLKRLSRERGAEDVLEA